MMTIEEKIAMLEEIMDLDEGTLSPEDILEDYEEWDSLSKLSLIAEVKKQMGEVLDVDTIRGFITVQDVCDYFKV